MRLIACRLRRVRQHADLQLDFGKALTLIGGANEAGKSTVVEALHKGLFLRSTATGRGVEELRSRLHAGLPEVEIRFEAAGQSWLLRKRFAGSGGTCQLRGGAGETLSGASAEEALAELLGVAGPIEGRRISQLPERWAHLWVRQGDAGLNPLRGGPQHYDHSRLLNQLQVRGSGISLESPRDRRLLEQLQQQLDLLFTGTGRVRAGSPLALAQTQERESAERLEQARQRVNQLEDAMEQLRQIAERLRTIDQDLRPALQQQQEQDRRRRLLLAERQPLLQELQQLEQQQQEHRQLLEQRRTQERQQLELQQQLSALEAEQLPLERQVHERRQQLEQREARRRVDQVRLELVQLHLEEQQLQEHHRQFQSLQEQASRVKGQLAALAAIGPEQVRQLRQAEQALAQAEARCQSMATRLEVIGADQPVRLEQEHLQPGDQRDLLASAELRVGDGVCVRISPGGGQALPQARAEQQRWSATLQQLRGELGVAGSEAAERVERERQAHELQLAHLRQAAASIPWADLEQRLAAIVPRRQQLEQNLRERQSALRATGLSPALEAAGPLSGERAELEAQQRQLRSASAEGDAERDRLQQELAVQEERQRQLQTSRQQSAALLAERSGSLTTLVERLQRLEHQSGAPATREQRRQQLLERLQACEAALQALGGPDATDPAADASAADPGEVVAAALQRMEQEREQLLTRRGQTEQLCLSLGAIDPLAELEQCTAAWEDAVAQRQQLERRGQALQLLQQRFHHAQSAMADRYSQPLRQAIHPYLQALLDQPGGTADRQALLRFDPQDGFDALQLRQAGEAYGFEQLSGGMREQLAAALRLAMAEVLLPAYDHALPLVFDDAFTNTDRQRLEGLQQMLRHGMQQGVQIVLLSCHPEDYTTLTAHKEILPDMAGEDRGGHRGENGEQAAEGTAMLPVPSAAPHPDVVSVQLS